ncbi:MAG: DUF3662 domain-containing protein [Anaerolineae bacterium]|nr:DUF3662 domain-containing protein [Anaerolineae bacterium]
MRLESWIEQLVEEPFVRLFAGRLLPQDVAQHLVRALEDGERIGNDGILEVPGRYRIALNPDDMEALRAHHPDLSAQLTDALKALATRMNVRLKEPPVIILQPDIKLPLHAVRITPADQLAPDDEQTRDLDLLRIQSMLTQETGNTTRAYLIVQGERSFDLNQPIIRIGRSLDNDLILEQQGISRHHAQLRHRYGRYIFQDLGSSCGSKVNGFSVQEIVLRPGDLISLSGVDLIYAEEEKDKLKKASGTQPLQALEV